MVSKKKTSEKKIETPQVVLAGTCHKENVEWIDDLIKSRIFTIRGVQVMFDCDLASFYGVPTKRLNEQVRRNVERFPEDFMFQPTADELASLRSQFATSNSGRGGTRYAPYVFTEHGIIMLASVLKSGVAVEASIRITHAFVAMRRALSSIAPLLNRIDVVERRQITDQSRNEERFDAIFKAMDGEDFPQQKVFFEGTLSFRRVTQRPWSAVLRSYKDG